MSSTCDLYSSLFPTVKPLKLFIVQVMSYLVRTWDFVFVHVSLFAIKRNAKLTCVMMAIEIRSVGCAFSMLSTETCKMISQEF